MAYLTLNGIDVPVVGSSRDVVYVGEQSGRSFSGAHRRASRGRKSEWHFLSAPLSQADSLAFQALINGLGVHFPIRSGQPYGTWDSTQGHRATITGTTWTSSAPDIYGLGLNDANKYTSRITWALPAGVSTWTLISVGGLRDSSSTNRDIWTSDGRRWVNATRSDTLRVDRLVYDVATGTLQLAAPAYQPTLGAPGGAADRLDSQARSVGSRAMIGGRAYEVEVAGTTAASSPTFNTAFNSTTADGGVTWRCVHADSSIRMQDMTFLPFTVPDAWVAQMDTWLNSRPSTRDWSDCPQLVAAGTGLLASVTVRGEVLGVSFLPGAGGAVLEALEFTLREV